MSFPSASPILQPTASLSVKKRKRDDAPNTDIPAEIDSRPFAIRPAGDNLSAKTTNLTPVCVLQRANLPLAALDLQGSGSRLFAAHIHTLEALHENGVEGHILVAEQKEEGRLYVVERAAKRIYALCRLGQWITKDALNRLSQARPNEPTSAAKRRITAPANTAPWWSRAAVDLPKERPQDVGKAKLLQFALPTQVLKDIPKLTSDKAGVHTANGAEDTNAQRAPGQQNPDTAIADSEPQDPVEELAKQYLDALYLSRTSLAYFAKGPLSRARSAITGGGDVLSTSSALVDFLRNSVLPVNVMDKKFKDNLPTLVKDLPLVTPSQDDKPVKSRRKKKFKSKRDKAGLFSNEQEYLEKWWRGEEISGSMTSPENTDTALRRRIPGLRTRETYLQVIIILETLYLETTNKATSTVVEESSLTLDSQGAETQDAESQAVPETTKRKGKKALDLRSLLETLLDRLCIWQDLDAHTPARSLLSSKDAKHNEPGNELRDFCVEIVVPFFMSRLPKEAALVNKKLGGPSPPSPEKRKSTSSRSRPGEPATRSRPEKQPRKPLTRVATETLNQTTRHMPTLHRSATDSTLIKREDSQPALSSIPPARPQSRPARESALSSYLSGHRQVDLAAKSAAASERLRKKKETEAQVREAINNARKPNRPLATKEVAARADEKFAQSLRSDKAPSRSSRPHQAQSHSQPTASASIHVAATPKKSHSQHANMHHPTHDYYNNHTTSFIPTSTHSSNPSLIPASSIRPRLGPHTDNLPAVPQTGHRDTRRTTTNAIDETPSRSSTSKFAFLSPEAVRSVPIGFEAACESPTAGRRSQIAATPVKMVGRRVDFGSVREIAGGGGKAQVAVEATPVKAASPFGIFGKKDNLRDGGQQQFGEGKSVYDAWNEMDDYEELA
jgi:DNA replication regulator SLD3